MAIAPITSQISAGLTAIPAAALPGSGSLPSQNSPDRATAPNGASIAPASTPVENTPAVATPEPDQAQIDDALAAVQQALQPVARNLQFSVDKESGRSVIKVVDLSTRQVIRQIPSEELLAITHALDSLSGLFVRQKV